LLIKVSGNEGGDKIRDSRQCGNVQYRAVHATVKPSSVLAYNSAFVNLSLMLSTVLIHTTGLRRWEAARAIWLKDASESSDASTIKAAKPLDVDEIIDLIFSQRWRTHQESDKANFPEPVPLPQMVDILVDLWEAEGLDI
jgi:hypothetical protein